MRSIYDTVVLGGEAEDPHTTSLGAPETALGERSGLTPAISPFLALAPPGLPHGLGDFGN